MKPQEEKDFKQLFSSLEPEQPSMRFTKNVMDSIEGLPVAKVSKNYVNPWIVKGIAAMLIVAIVVLCIYTYTSADNFSMPGTDILGKLSGKAIPYFIGGNIIMILLLAERWITGKNRINNLAKK